MFWRYSRQKTINGRTVLTNPQQDFLFGKKGLIYRVLHNRTSFGTLGNAYVWHIDVNKELGANDSFVINIKPKAQIYDLVELLDIWGFSERQYTPLMFRAQIVFDKLKSTDNASTIYPDEAKDRRPIYWFLYTASGIDNNSLHGKWSSPPRSATNGALLFPPHLSYFIPLINASDGGPLSPSPAIPTV